MFLYVTIFELTALVCVSDSLFQSLLLELIGELLTTILIPYNMFHRQSFSSQYECRIGTFWDLKPLWMP